MSLSLLVGISLPCNGGFICLGGSDVPEPTDGIEGYPCPAGHYCESGDVTETPCDLGSYGPRETLGKMILQQWLYNCYVIEVSHHC